MWWAYHSSGSYEESDASLILPDPCSAYDELLCPYCGESDTLSTLEVVPVGLDEFVGTQIGFPLAYEICDEVYRFFLSGEEFSPHADYWVYMLTLYRGGEPIASTFLDTSIDSYFSVYGVDEDEDQWLLSFGVHQVFLLPQI